LAIQQFLRSRRSIREFLAEPVHHALLENILETGMWASSAHNRQPWRFAVLETKASQQKLIQAMEPRFEKDLVTDGIPPEEISNRLDRSRRRILGAPVTIILCMDLSEMDIYPDEERLAIERVMAEQSVALAGGTILLAAHAAGLGGVWLCAPLFAQQEIQKSLNLPKAWIPQALLLVGYPGQKPDSQPRKPLEEVSVFL
jgi:coenzyme F420-0:L-glutamate ligase / coenzyme F420-1:gamma-L-glutamate ligase